MKMNIIASISIRESCFILMTLLGLSMIISCTNKGIKSTDSFMQQTPLIEFEDPAYQAPDWIRNAVIMEIPIRAFLIILIIIILRAGKINMLVHHI